MPQEVKPEGIEAIREQLGTEEPRCTWPHCPKVGDVVGKLEVTNEKGSFVEMPFCWYHKIIIDGKKFTAIKIDYPGIEEKSPYDFQMQGPFQEVEVAEQVLAAKEMADRIEKEKDKKKESKN